MSFYSSAKPSTPSSHLDLSTDATASEQPTDSISALSFSPTADILSVASWDNKVRLYEVNPTTGNANKRAEYEHAGPVLDNCWFSDGSKAISGGLDNAVRAYDIQSGQSAQIGQHDAPVKCVELVDAGQPIIASASWDKTLRYWDMRQPGQAIATVALPERAYAMATEKKLLVVGCAGRQVCIFDLSNPGQIFRTIQSQLKMQTRTLACHEDGAGFAIGSIEGRCAIQYVDPALQAEKGFSFKCHRETVTTPRSMDKVFALDSISFHPIHGTFATTGADGTIAFWDKEAKFRLRYSKNLGGAVVASAFNRSGSLLAYALSYDWSKGYQYNTPAYPTAIKVHVVRDLELKPRATGAKTNKK